MDWQLPEPFLHQVLGRCHPSDVARIACVSRRFLSLTSDDSLWKDLCLHHFDVSTPHDHAGLPCPSFKETFRIWHANFAKYPRSVVIRAKRVWERLRNWLSNFPEVAVTLQSGASEEELDDVEQRFGWKLPLPVRVLYRFCNGQDTHWDFEEDGYEPVSQHSFSGLLGGYHFYRHVVNVHLLPLRQVVIFSQHFLPPWGITTNSKRIIVASSYNLNKFFLLDCADGMIYVGTRNLISNGEMMPCVPFVQNDTNEEDAMLRWLEKYSLHLETGMFALRKHDTVYSISIYPEREPLCTEAVTCGVQVRCSAAFVPELSSLLDDDDDKYLFSYFVRMRLLHSGSGSSCHSFASCQLYKRHWKIRANDGAVTEVHAEAVIGLYPLLRPDEEAFTYCSCTALSSPLGSVEGGFTFVPGKLSSQEGADFLAKVARFPLEVPDFVF